ncbi:hypothetical protein BKA62DRAFT_721797 [Auriculariales sp. MPI-PUGE-AT-0066]|nr:hypothetical protein BKA62DRAFT_721797 [Auriculariales sp. MPI-PUGE-AT-0066]
MSRPSHAEWAPRLSLMTYSRPTRLTRPFLPSLVVLAQLATAQAYTFTLAAQPSQCGNLTVNWTGGQPPYELLLVPVGHVNPEIRTIVDQKINSGNSTSLTLKFPEGSQFVASLSDASGPGAGGTSDVLTVGSGSSDCLTGTTQAKWVLYMDGTPNQCNPTRISWDSSAAGPVSMWGVIPGGSTFNMGAPSSDSNGRGTGGSTDVFTVGDGSGSCVNNQSPSTTPGPAAGQVVAVASVPSSSTSNPSSASPTSSTSNKHGNSSDDGKNGDDHGNDDDDSDTSNANENGDTVCFLRHLSHAAPCRQESPTGGTHHSMNTSTIAAILLAILGLFFCLRSRRRHQRRAENDSFSDMRGRGDLLASTAPSIAESGGIDSILTRAPHENVPRAYTTTPFVMRPRGGEFEHSHSTLGGPALMRSQSGYGADVSDGNSTSAHGQNFTFLGTHGHGTTDEDFADAHLLASPLPTPSQEKSAYLDPFSDHHAASVNRTPSYSPPSFKTLATGGHSVSNDGHEADSERADPSMYRSPPHALIPQGGISSWTLNDPEVPPSYNSLRAKGQQQKNRNLFQSDPDSRFISLHQDDATGSSGH